MRHAARLLIFPVALFAVLATSATAQDVSLPGTWYVLVHYKDDASPNPDAERWEDKVWVFGEKGRRLEWTEYPIVVFDDESGRFERRATGQYARIMHYWEPDASQQADIADGLKVNSRGSKNKTLRGSDAKGWTSGRRQSAASASMITYEEVWSIDDMPKLPVFTRRDYMGGGSMDSMEGAIRYATTEVRDGGDVLVGTFERDGSRHGTFRMMRSGEIGSLEQKSQREIQAQGVRRSIRTSQLARETVTAQIEASLLESGVTLEDEELVELSELGLSLLADGVPEQTVRERLAKRTRELMAKELAAGLPDAAALRGAAHDDGARYRFPFDPSTPRQLSQGVGGDTSQGMMGSVSTNRLSHKGGHRFAFDFSMPVGTDVLAARGGTVVRVVDHFTEGGPMKGLMTKGNVVIVRHDDGTFARYVHLSPGAAVEPGQTVAAGDVLGKSGNTGYSTGPHLHFDVERMTDDGDFETVPIRFDDGTQAGVVPITGSYYGGS